MAKEQQLSLWYMRPKIHMMQHVGLLGCNISASRSNHTHGSNSNSDFHSFLLENWDKSLVPRNLMLKRFGHPRLEMSHHMEDPMTEWILNPHSLEPRNLGNWGTSQNMSEPIPCFCKPWNLSESVRTNHFLFSLRGAH